MTVEKRKLSAVFDGKIEESYEVEKVEVKEAVPDLLHSATQNILALSNESVPSTQFQSVPPQLPAFPQLYIQFPNQAVQPVSFTMNQQPSPCQRISTYHHLSPSGTSNNIHHQKSKGQITQTHLSEIQHSVVGKGHEIQQSRNVEVCN